MARMRYILGIDLGAKSLGWAILRLDKNGEPCAIVKTGVRIFSDGRHPKTGTSLAVERRIARGMRRRRDRLLKRKSRLMDALIKFGFFPDDENARKEMELICPYSLRAKGLDEALTGPEFARALFHLNQRRGFKSNRKMDTDDSDSGAMKGAISELRRKLQASGSRTVGEWLAKEKLQGNSVRARSREVLETTATGRQRKAKQYDLYVDRAMIEQEFDALWSAQCAWNPNLFTDEARAYLRDTLLFQRPLRPVDPGRCTLLPDLPRAPVALPSSQAFRIYQELNNLRILGEVTGVRELSLDERDLLAEHLLKNDKLTFRKMRSLLKLASSESINLEDERRDGLQGNSVAKRLSSAEAFGDAWFQFEQSVQDEIVDQILNEESESTLNSFLVGRFAVEQDAAKHIAHVKLPDGYMSLSTTAISRILPYLVSNTATYDKAVKFAGFDHHSDINRSRTGEVHQQLPYYGELLTRHIGFGTGNPSDLPEKRYGKIANPSVHVALNQVRTIVNAIINKYGHPDQIVVELARELKQSKKQKDEFAKRQAENQKRNDIWRKRISELLEILPENVRRDDIEKGILWEELSPDPLHRRCPYTGVQITPAMLFSREGIVQVDHILPYSRTLDDSRNNKVVSMRYANAIKGDRTPFEAFGKTALEGYDYEQILDRAKEIKVGNKAKRFRADAEEIILAGHGDFLARSLNDTRYMSKITALYLDAVCPGGVCVVPGTLTEMIRRNFGLNQMLNDDGGSAKNRTDHRHHAIDAVVVAVTNRRLLQQVSTAAARAEKSGAERLVEKLDLPWPTFREQLHRSLADINVSHRPNHGHEGQLMEDTAWGFRKNGTVRSAKRDAQGNRETTIKRAEQRSLIPIYDVKRQDRHGHFENGEPRPMKGYVGGSNYAVEIDRTNGMDWSGQVITTYEQYQNSSTEEHKLPNEYIHRLMINDAVQFTEQGRIDRYRVCTISKNGQIFLARLHESNVDARNRDKSNSFKYISKTPRSLGKLKAEFISVSPLGRINKLR